uniref:J domain-containing protein n=1 Tax=Leptocylindrus danicus TaxID=163516 RepID=A0A7S2LRN8_9STRA
MASDLIAAAFGKDFNLYTTVLECGEGATASQLRKAYHKRALKFHPDKQSDCSPAELELATKRFQAVSAAYDILKDEEKRKVYDATGELDDDGMINEDSVQQWTEFFRAMFKKVSTRDIDEFGAKYKKSEEEAADVLKYYEICKGDLNKMLTCVMLSENEDVQRWMKDIIEPAILRGDVPRYDMLDRTLQSYGELMDTDDEDSSTNNCSDKKRSPRKRAGKGAKMSKKDKMDYRSAKKKKEEEEAADLFAKIRGQRSGAVAKHESAFDDMISALENKYADSGKKSRGKRGKGKKTTVHDDIPDDEFERIQARIWKKK